MSCLYPITVRGEALMHATGEVVYERVVPCGRCSGCVGRHAYNVYKRLEYESSLYDEHPLFITMTYDEDNIPLDLAYRPVLATQKVTDPYTGCVTIIEDRYRKSKQKAIDFANHHPYDLYPHVSKRDCQLYMKKLRHRLGDGLRFMLLAEYGGDTARPHYHMILYNHRLGLTEQSQAYDMSVYFADIWAKGYCLCELCPTAAMKYVSGYHAIRQFSPDGSTPSFILSSRNPGIGHLKPIDSQWVKDHSYTDRAHAYMRLSSYQRKQVYPDGDFLATTTDNISHKTRAPQVDEWFRRHKLRDHGKFTDNKV